MPSHRDECAYLAGILDGEGCISVQKRGPYLTPVVQVTNTRYELLWWIQERYGGTIYRQKDSRPTRKPAWHWSTAGQKALRVVRDARPFLLLKWRHADLLFALPRFSTTSRDALGRIKGVMTEADRAANQELVAKIRALNKRGAA